ncbi:MAG: ABC transporter ATP-binding protein [Planctomycetota bacterium]|jgi:branched-chain amino acid transport system ATP-binding protein
MDFLAIRKLSRFFGGLAAVMDLDMVVDRGQIFGLIGPNGAGKSTVLNMIGGTVRPNQGEIIFNEKEVTRLPPHVRAEQGIGRVFQENLLFTGFTVLQNVLVGYHLQWPIGVAGIFLKTSANRSIEENVLEKALDTLEFAGLSQYADEMAVNLPHGRQRVLALAVALASQPQLLLLDEPVTGMNAAEVETMLDMIRALREKKGITCIVIEHNLKAVMGLCDRIAVLNFGLKIAEGIPAEIVRNPAVMEAYLGTEEDVF